MIVVHHAAPAVRMDLFDEMLARFREADGLDEDAPIPVRTIDEALAGGPRVAMIDGQATAITEHRDESGRLIGIALEEMH